MPPHCPNSATDPGTPVGAVEVVEELLLVLVGLVDVVECVLVIVVVGLEVEADP